MLLDFFSKPDKPLGNGSFAPWGQLTATAFEVASERPASDIIDECAAMEFLNGAMDILDDIEDVEPEDWSRGASPAAVLNLSTFALVRALELLGAESDDPIITERKRPALPRLMHCLLEVGRGQGTDLTMGGQSLAPEEWSIEVLRQRSGTIGRLVCEYGARLGCDDEALAKRFGDFGEKLIMYGQLVNDMQDIAPHAHKRGDLESRKLTLPIAIAARLTGKSPWDLDISDIERSGAATIAWTRSRVFLAEAKTILNDLDCLDRFGEFIPELRP